PEWRTGGMVRALLSRSEVTVSTMPEDAVMMASLAVEISNHATDGGMLRLSGLSYYHRGYGHWYIGKVMEALEDLERADAALIPCIGADLDRGRVWLVKAMAVQAVGNFGEAFRLAEQAESIFVRFGDRDRIAASRTIVVTLLEDAQKPREA